MGDCTEANLSIFSFSQSSQSPLQISYHCDMNIETALIMKTKPFAHEFRAKSWILILSTVGIVIVFHGLVLGMIPLVGMLAVSRLSCQRIDL